MSEEEREALVRQGRSLLSPAERCPDKEYAQRIRLCEACEGLLPSKTCVYCGCLVHVRALRKTAACPYPGDNKWAGLG